MAKLSSSFRERNRTTRSFRERNAILPTFVQDAVRTACELFNANPAHSSLRHHELNNPKEGSHEPGSFSVSVNMQYRAVYIPVDGINVWYWVGTHAQYKHFTGGAR